MLSRGKISIAVFVILILVTVTTALTGTLGLIVYHAESHGKWADLRNESGILTEQLAAGLAMPVWNLDTTQIGKVVESVMSNHNVSSVVVTLKDQKGTRVARARDGSWGVTAVDTAPTTAGALSEQRDITFSGEVIGSVELRVTSTFIAATLRKTLATMVGTVFALDAILVLSLYALLWGVVLRPLRKLQRYAVAVSSEEKHEPGLAQKTLFLGELETLRESLEKTVGLLEQRYADMLKDEEALRASATQWQATFDAVADAVWLLDENQRILRANKATLTMFGKTPDEVIGRLCHEVVHETTCPITECPYLSTRSSLHRESMELAAGKRWLEIVADPIFDDDGRIRGLVHVVSDITERKQAEEQVRHLKNYLSNIIDSMPSLLVGFDHQECVTQWNKQAEALTHIPAAEAMGKKVKELLPDFAPWFESMRGAITQRHPVSMEKLPLLKNGERHFYDVISYPLVADGVEGAVVRIEDVTERNRIQELIIQTEKMVSLGGLAAGMAHEINNPLGIITLSAQNIERRIQPDLPPNQETAKDLGLNLDDVRAYLVKREIPQFIQTIKTAASRAAKIVSNMLQFSRKSESTMQPINLPELLDRTVELAANDYDLKKRFDFRSIVIVRDYSPGIPAVSAVAVELEQVFLNLIKNAAQALDANPPERAPRITLGLRREGDYAVVMVKDNGPGMDESVRSRVFEPFFTTKPPGLGTGLGLSVSYMIITRNHKGLISVNSSLGEGAQFVVQLPLAAKETPS